MKYLQSGQSLKTFWRCPMAQRAGRCSNMSEENASVGRAVGIPAGVGG
jgi:hypothetical protein